MILADTLNVSVITVESSFISHPNDTSLADTVSVEVIAENKLLYIML